MERYETYKDSGILWIDKIPDEWAVRRLKHLLKSEMQYGATESGEEYAEVLPRYIRITDITQDGLLRDGDKKSLPYELANPFILEDRDLLFARSGATVGKTFLYRREMGLAAFAGYLIRACTNRDLLMPEYLNYWTQTIGYDNWKLSIFNQATIQNIGADKYKELPVAYPNLEAQHAIVNYLDAKTAEIDALVADCKREFELLLEYRKAVISEAVTKGLDPEAPMKDSGVEWIGEIPAGWSCAKLGLIATTTLGRMLDADKQIGNCLAPYLSNKDVQWFNIDDSDLKEMDFPFEMRESYEIHEGDMLVCEGGEVGRSTVWHGPTPSYYFQKAIHRVRFDLSVMNPDYAAYQMFQKAQVTMFREVRKGESTIGHLPGDQLRQLTFVVPPIEVQDEIVNYLNTRIGEVDSLIDSKQSMVDKLREYRKSLVSEAVTGKFKVPGVR